MNSTRYYVIGANGEPVAVSDIGQWASSFEFGNRIVKQEQIGEAFISTVFLGLDHGWTGGSPIVWETMVFGGYLDQKQDRCAGSREQAEAMHARMVERVKLLK